MKRIEQPNTWVQQYIGEVIANNQIGSSWTVYNTLGRVVATDTKTTTAIVNAFNEAGYEMRQLKEGDWEIRMKRQD